MICKILSKNPLHNLIVSSPLAPISHSFIADDCSVTGPSLVAQMVKDLHAMLGTEVNQPPEQNLTPAGVQ